MKVVYCKEVEKTGNECLIKNLYAIIEVFGKYQALNITRYEGGWVTDEPDMRLVWCDTEDEAKKEITRMMENNND